MKKRRSYVHWLILLAGVEIVLPVAMSVFRNRLVFIPYATPTADSRLAYLDDVDARVVRVTRPDGRQLDAYDATPAGADPDSVPVVLFFHGNAGNIGMRAGLLSWIVQKTGARVLMLGYSGYGGNDGSPSEDDLYADALAAYDHLAAEGVPPSRIVVLGESLGAAAAIYVASERETAGVVTQAAFSSLSSIALKLYWWMPLGSLLVTGAFPNVDRIESLDEPILLVHGTDDEIIPFSESARLLQAAPAGTELHPIEGGDHNGLFDVAGDAYLEMLGDRFRKWTGIR